MQYGLALGIIDTCELSHDHRRRGRCLCPVSQGPRPHALRSALRLSAVSPHRYSSQRRLRLC